MLREALRSSSLLSHSHCPALILNSRTASWRRWGFGGKATPVIYSLFSHGQSSYRVFIISSLTSLDSKQSFFFHSEKSKLLTPLYYSFLFLFTNKLIFPVLAFLVICYHNPPTLTQTCYLVFLQVGWDTLGTQIFGDQHNLWPNYILTCSYQFTLTSAVGKT